MARASRRRPSEKSTWRQIESWLFTTNSSRVGVVWIAVSIAFFLLAGILALLMRTELALPGRQIMGPESYNANFTLHGTQMVFFFAVPVFFGFGSLIVPRAIGATNVAYPRLNNMDLWFMILGGLLLEVGYLLNMKPAGGWTGYVPLTLKAYSPGLGVDWWAWAIFFETFGTTLAGANILTAILAGRKRGMRLIHMPLFVWAIGFAALLIMVAGPNLMTNMLFLLLDRNLGTTFFSTTSEASILLWQDLFWFYSHPATYIMLVPAFGIGSSIIARFSGRKLFGYAIIVTSLFILTFFSYLVWYHHMFTTGMPTMLSMFGSAMTWAVSIPSGIIIFTWLASMWRGRIRFSASMLWILGLIVMITIGGADGVYMAFIPLDVYLHDTYWLVAHFHYIIVGATLFGTFAGVYFWFPVGLGRMLDETLGKIHFWGTFVGMNVLFFPMHMLGLDGMPRRIWDYLGHPEWTLSNLVATAGAYIAAAAQIVFLVNLGLTLWKGRHVEPNVWGPPTAPPGVTAQARQEETDREANVGFERTETAPEEA